jgi:hypothetical protein
MDFHKLWIEQCEAAWHQGRPSAEDFLPFFSCKAVDGAPLACPATTAQITAQSSYPSVIAVGITPWQPLNLLSILQARQSPGNSVCGPRATSLANKSHDWRKSLYESPTAPSAVRLFSTCRPWGSSGPIAPIRPAWGLGPDRCDISTFPDWSC